MTEPRARRRLADRSAELWRKGGVTYSQAVDEALAEQNPTGDATTGERLLYALLNVDEPVIHAKRRSPRATTERDDTISDWRPTPGGDPAPDAPDGGETFRP